MKLSIINIFSQIYIYLSIYTTVKTNQTLFKKSLKTPPKKSSPAARLIAPPPWSNPGYGPGSRAEFLAFLPTLGS